jgi:hypothetical protein
VNTFTAHYNGDHWVIVEAIDSGPGIEAAAPDKTGNGGERNHNNEDGAGDAGREDPEWVDETERKESRKKFHANDRAEGREMQSWALDE